MQDDSKEAHEVTQQRRHPHSTKPKPHPFRAPLCRFSGMVPRHPLPRPHWQSTRMPRPSHAPGHLSKGEATATPGTPSDDQRQIRSHHIKLVYFSLQLASLR